VTRKPVILIVSDTTDGGYHCFRVATLTVAVDGSAAVGHPQLTIKAEQNPDLSLAQDFLNQVAAKFGDSAVMRENST